MNKIKFTKLWGKSTKNNWFSI